MVRSPSSKWIHPIVIKRWRAGESSSWEQTGQTSQSTPRAWCWATWRKRIFWIWFITMYPYNCIHVWTCIELFGNVFPVYLHMIWHHMIIYWEVHSVCFLFSEHACIVVALGQGSHLCHVPASGDGDMMTMEGMTQKHFQHRVPKEACAGAKKKQGHVISIYFIIFKKRVVNMNGISYTNGNIQYSRLVLNV